MKKRIISLIIAVAIVLSLGACAKKPEEQTTTTKPQSTQDLTAQTMETTTKPETTTTQTTLPPLKIKASSPKKNVAVGEQFKVKATLNRDDYKQEQIQWSSSNPDAVYVDSQGNVITLAVGDAYITAKIGDTVSNKVLICSQIFVEKLEMKKENVEINVSQSLNIANDVGYTVLPENATKKSEITWSSSNKNVANFYDGKLVGYSQGTCTLTAKSNVGKEIAKFNVKVNPKPSRDPSVFGFQLASFSTSYAESNKNRSTNLKIATKAIDGTVIKPGQQFSFNAVVGERTVAKGYKDAIVFNGGKEEKGLAGGICQVSSTLFNTALLSNMKINKRSPHSLKVKYVPYGRDAAIMWGAQDLVFTNTYDMDILIEGTCANGVCEFRIYAATTEEIKMPKIEIKSGGSGSKWWMQRIVDGKVDYKANSTYQN